MWRLELVAPAQHRPGLQRNEVEVALGVAAAPHPAEELSACRRICLPQLDAGVRDRLSVAVGDRADEPNLVALGPKTGEVGPVLLLDDVPEGADGLAARRTRRQRCPSPSN